MASAGDLAEGNDPSCDQADLSNIVKLKEEDKMDMPEGEAHSANCEVVKSDPNVDDCDENNMDANGGLVMDTTEITDPYKYTRREEFTSEIFKVEIENLPKNYGFAQLKKRLQTALKLNPHKIKAMPRTNFAFVTFRNEEDRNAGLERIQGHVWKGKVLRVKKAQPAADPLLKKRKLEQEQYQGKKQRVEEDDDTPPGVRLLKNVSPYWGMPYEEQLKKKESGVAEVLKSLATDGQTRNYFFEQRKKYNGMCCPLLPILPSPQLEGYRNKSEFSIGKGDQDEDAVVGFRFGLYKDGLCNVGPPDNIPIIPDSMKKVVKFFQQYLGTSQYSVFNPQNHTGHYHQLTVRTTLGKDIMAIAEFHPQQLTDVELTAEKEAMRVFFTEGVGQEAEITSLYFHQSKARATSQKEEPYELVAGETHIYEEILGLKFRISPDAFFQVNTKAAEVLYKQIADWCDLTSETTVLDICCGTGTIGLSMAKKVEKVMGVEMCKQAIEDAEENAKLNGIKNVKYFCSKAEDVIGPMTSSLWSKDAVAVVDPPRAGLHKKVIKALRGCHKLKRLVYVACNARSAKQNFIDLIRQETKKHRGDGFLPVKAIPVDLFPQTPHCEVVILFERHSTDAVKPSNVVESPSTTADTDGKSCTGKSCSVAESATNTAETDGSTEKSGADLVDDVTDMDEETGAIKDVDEAAAPPEMDLDENEIKESLIANEVSAEVKQS